MAGGKNGNEDVVRSVDAIVCQDESTCPIDDELECSSIIAGINQDIATLTRRVRGLTRNSKSNESKKNKRYSSVPMPEVSY